MKRAVPIIILLAIAAFSARAQEIRASVKVGSGQVEGLDANTVRALELIIRETFNNTRWTDIDYEENERVNVNFAMTVTAVGADNKNDIRASIDFTVSRTVYNSNYLSPLVSYHDKNAAFYFDDWQSYTYKANSFSSGLMSIISFYALTAIAVDQMSLAEDGGTRYISQAREVAATGDANDMTGFKEAGGSQDRVMLAADLQSPSFDGLRRAFYRYHRLGLDAMSGSVAEAKRSIADAITAMEPTARRNINSVFIRAMIEAKASEIEGIFSAGTTLSNMEDVRKALKIIAPGESSRWDRLR